MLNSYGIVDIELEYNFQTQTGQSNGRTCL